MWPIGSQPGSGRLANDPIADIGNAVTLRVMPLDQTKRDAACAELRNLLTILQQKIAKDELLANEMIFECRRILNLWIESGGESTDDVAIAFLGIESQSDHVLGGCRVEAGRDVDRIRFEPGSAAETKEVHEIGQFFKESFRRAIVELAEHMGVR